MLRKISGLFGCLVLLATIVGSASTVKADQGFYVIDASARTGMLMVANEHDANVADPATASRADHLIGILGDQPTSFDFQDGQKNILTSGIANTLVSTINGEITKGSYITATSITGVGGRINGSGWVVGVAQADFTPTSPEAVKTTVTNATGQNEEVFVGTIPVLIKVTYFDDTDAEKARDISFLPQSLQQSIDSVAGRRASQIALFLAAALLLIGLLIGSLIAYSAIKNGIQSTARQPLAKQIILRRMIQSCLMALGIIFASVVGALTLIRIL